MRGCKIRRSTLSSSRIPLDAYLKLHSCLVVAEDPHDIRLEFRKHLLVMDRLVHLSPIRPYQK